MSARSTPSDAPRGITFREAVEPGDQQAVRRIVESTGFFYPAEVDVAVELVQERLQKGEASGYHFVFATREGEGPTAYACFGPIACTVGSYDLYWIAVMNDARGTGLGRRVLAEAERRIAHAGGMRVYIETSSRELYEPTRQFYLRCGYRIAAVLVDFYAPGDDKVVLVKARTAEGGFAGCL